MKATESIGTGPSELTTNAFYRDRPENRLVPTSLDILLDSTCSTEILSWKLSRVKFKNGIYLTRSSFYGFISSEFGALHEYFLRSIVILKHPQKIGSILFSKLGALWLYEVWTFQLLQSVLKKVTPAASSRKGIMYQWEIEFCWSIPQ